MSIKEYLQIWDDQDFWEEDEELAEAQAVVGRRRRRIVRGKHPNLFFKPCQN